MTLADVLLIEARLAVEEAAIATAATALRAAFVARKPLVDAVVAARAQIAEGRPHIRTVAEVFNDESKAWLASIDPQRSNTVYDTSSVELVIFAPVETLR